MPELIEANALNKRYGKDHVLKDINLSIASGEIVGLIGPNGAGKTTLLKNILGLSPYEGELSILGINPKKQRNKLMENVSFIADTATLPSWIKVKDAITFMEKVHPRFSREQAENYLASTNIELDKKISQLSKGMVTKTHLSLVMAINSELLVLDEPTLGLDIIKRKEFYQQLLGDYFDKEKTILITTHQVEEIENILTRALFINDGKIIFDGKLEEIENRYKEVLVHLENQNKAEQIIPIHKTMGIKGTTYIYQDKDTETLEKIGRVSTPSLADLFVAMIQGN